MANSRTKTLVTRTLARVEPTPAKNRRPRTNHRPLAPYHQLIPHNTRPARHHTTLLHPINPTQTSPILLLLDNTSNSNNTPAMARLHPTASSPTVTPRPHPANHPQISTAPRHTAVANTRAGTDSHSTRVPVREGMVTLRMPVFPLRRQVSRLTPRSRVMVDRVVGRSTPVRRTTRCQGSWGLVVIVLLGYQG